jgi:hypothetical protein
MPTLEEPRKIFDQWPLLNSTDYIEELQLDSGLIPWYKNGAADPWDHVESTMALSLTGRREAAEQAYNWLSENQLPDGSWWAIYESNSEPGRSRRETHRVAYVATGVWHQYLIVDDDDFLRSMWPAVRDAIEFTLKFQTDHGDVEWAKMKDGSIDHDSLLTGNSSIYHSLKCAIEIARTTGNPYRNWVGALKRLGRSIRNKPHRFDRTWESKRRYAMDWFYPVLSGAQVGELARERIESRWNEFVEEGFGCRCVTDEPWVTVAETCELVMTLKSIGKTAEAEKLFSWIHQWLDDDGGYWTGYQMEKDIHWPDEKPTWTAGAVLLAADALLSMSDASHLFTEHVQRDREELLAGQH